MATTQYVAGSDVLRFPDKIGSPKRPPGLIAGEHGFRFFPAYYLHIWDTCGVSRSTTPQASRRPRPCTTRRTGRRASGNRPQRPTVARDPTRSTALDLEARGSLQEMLQLGSTPADLSTFFGRFRALPHHITATPRGRSRGDLQLRLSRRSRPDDGRRSVPVQRRVQSSSCTTCRASSPHSTRRRGRAHQLEHVRPAQHVARPLRQQGRRGAQRTDDRSVVRSVVRTLAQAERRVRARDARELRPDRIG